MDAISMIGKHYVRIFDESLPTCLLEMRKRLVMKLIPVINMWVKSGAPPFMVEEMFEPFFDEIASLHSEDDSLKIAAEIEEVIRGETV